MCTHPPKTTRLQAHIPLSYHLLTPQFLVAMALRAQEVLQQAQQPKHLLGEAGQDPSGGLFDVAQG